jgi:hypothetical protein
MNISSSRGTYIVIIYTFPRRFKKSIFFPLNIFCNTRITCVENVSIREHIHKKSIPPSQYYMDNFLFIPKMSSILPTQWNFLPKSKLKVVLNHIPPGTLRTKIANKKFLKNHRYPLLIIGVQRPLLMVVFFSSNPNISLSKSHSAWASYAREKKSMSMYRVHW